MNFRDWVATFIGIVTAYFVFKNWGGGPIQLSPSVTTSNTDHPYRAAAVVDSYEEPKSVPTEVPKPKKKRDPIVFSKPTKVFLFLLPALILDVGMGFIYDTSILGVGAKWGCAVAILVLNVFFIGNAIVEADK